MSKELDEALKNIRIRCHPKVVWDDPIDLDLEILNQALSKAQELEKVLEIAFKKRIDLESFYSSFVENYYDYNFYEKCYGTYGKYELTEEEFDLLKEYINEYRKRSEVK